MENFNERRHDPNSPLYQAFLDASTLSTAEIKVYLSHKKVRGDLSALSAFLFDELFKETAHSSGARDSGILIYVNLKAREFCIQWGRNIEARLSSDAIKRDLSKHFSDDLLSTHPENACALLVRTLAVLLQSDNR